MKCISLWQPWASLIAIGQKRVETRSWRTAYRGPLAIHAASQWNHDLYERCLHGPLAEALSLDETVNREMTQLDANPRRLKRFLPLGCIVAVCELEACLPTPQNRPGNPFVLFDPRRTCDADTLSYTIDSREREFGDYSPDRWAWILRSVRRLKAPVPIRGSQGLFEVADELIGGAL